MALYDWNSRVAALGALSPAVPADAGYVAGLLARLNSRGSDYAARFTADLDAQRTADEAEYASEVAAWVASSAATMEQLDRAVRYAESLEGTGAPSIPIVWDGSNGGAIIARAEAALTYPAASQLQPLLTVHLARARRLPGRPALQYSAALTRRSRSGDSVLQLEQRVMAIGAEADAFIGYMTSPIP